MLEVTTLIQNYFKPLPDDIIRILNGLHQFHELANYLVRWHETVIVRAIQRQPVSGAVLRLDDLYTWVVFEESFTHHLFIDSIRF